MLMGTAVSDVPDPTPPPPTRDPRVLDELLADGSLVLFHTGTRVLMTLNPTAALVWEYCDGRHDEATIVAEVEAVFPAAGPLAADVQTILIDLRSRGMLQPTALPAS